MFFGSRLAEKRTKRRLAPRITKNSLRERTCSAPGAIFVDFRVPARVQNSSKMRSRTQHKNSQKKNSNPAQTPDKDIRVGVMRWANGEVRRGHTSYDSLRRVTAIQCKVFHTPQDLLRRAADLKPYGSCRPPLFFAACCCCCCCCC